MAIEGSLVLPMFLFFIMTVLLSLEAVRFQSQVQEVLYQEGNRSAFLGYQVKYADAAKEDTQERINEYLGNQLYPYLCIRNGEKGIWLQDLSDPYTGETEYQVSYRLKPFIGWLPIGNITINDRFFSHAWTGYLANGTWEDNERQEIYVYITGTGSKYHLSGDCTYLRVSVQAVDYEQVNDLRNRFGGKYYACLRCRPLKGGIVYITSDGNSFHGQADCSALKRTVYMIPLSEAAEYDPCSKCAN